ncbi:MAG: UbiD family decarboxylase [Candidatus Diapherotrites archaeon]|nr:UbiD family decarboxylase [Candidatus Diapherotrites archaeon]
MGLRGFISEQEKKDRVIRVKKPVSSEYEIAALMTKTEGKISVFENVKGYDDVKVVSGIASSRDLLGEALGGTRQDIISKISKAMADYESFGYKFEKGTFEEKSFKSPDLIKHLPLTKFYEKEERTYTSASIVSVIDPETKVPNVSFHRMMYLGDNRFSIRITKRHLYTIMKKYNEKVPVAVFFGVHPAIEAAAATSYNLGMDEFKLANSLLDGNFKAAKVGDIPVPSSAEVVFKASIYPDRLEDEGPFVDLSGTWDLVRKEPLLEVEELFMRKDALYQNILPGGTEHRILMGVPQEPRIHKIVSNTIPHVKNVVLTEGGCSWLHGVVSIKVRNEGDGKNAGMAALAAHPSMKRVVIVDEDIDITDPVQVEWAITTRVQADRDVVIVPHAKGSSLDPSQNMEEGTMTKWIIDATRPFKLPEEHFMQVKVPGEDKINLNDYL